MNSIHMTLALILLIVVNPIESIGPGDLKPNHAKVGDFKMNMQSCGLTQPIRARRDTPVSRIVDGEEVAEISEFPWSASLHDPNRRTETFLCGATLVSRYWLLTAAHCLRKAQNRRNVSIYLGSTSLYQYVQKVDIDFDMPWSPFDITIFRVKQAIEPVLTASGDKYVINYVCLPVYNVTNNETEVALISGFGFTDVIGTKPSDRLRKAIYVIDSVQECKQKHNRPEDYICVTETVHNTCIGDYGSGLVQWDGNRAVVIGISSESSATQSSIEKGEFCGKGFVFFLRVSQFSDQFGRIIKDNVTLITIPYDNTSSTTTIATKPTPGDDNENPSDNSTDLFRYDFIVFMITIALILNILL